MLTMIYSFSCNSKKSISNQQRKPQTIKFHFTFPTVDLNNRFLVVQDSFYVSYFNDLVLYQFPGLHQYTKNMFTDSGELITSELIKIDTVFWSVVYKKSDSIGYLFDSASQKVGKKITAKEYIDQRFKIVDSLLFNETDSLIKKEVSKEGFSELYYRRKKSSIWDSDSVYLFFSNKFNKIDYSISKRLDSVRSSKLYKVRLIKNPITEDTLDYFRHRREVIMEIINIPGMNETEILKFWNRVAESEKDDKT